MNLHEALHAAVADPPPPQIDLDNLSRREKRRRHRTRWAAGVGGLATVVVMAVAAAGALSPNRGDPYQPATSPEQTVAVIPHQQVSASPPQAMVIARLTTVLQGLGPEYDVPAGRAFVVEQGDWGAAPDGHWYAARWTSGDVQLTVIVRRALIPLETECAKNGPDNSCERTEESDGSVSYTSVDGQSRQAESYRPDETAVMVSATGATSTFTEERLLAVARLAGWTLTGTP
jgi:hypothetical protein